LKREEKNEGFKLKSLGLRRGNQEGYFFSAPHQKRGLKGVLK